MHHEREPDEDPSSSPSRDETDWSSVGRIGRAGAATERSERVLINYWLAAHSYLMALVNRDEELANELSDEFALRFLRGDFSKATPEKGRFRDYIKAVLRNLVAEHFRKQTARARHSERVDFENLSNERIEAEFLDNLRSAIVASAMQRLALFQKDHGTPYYTALQLRSSHPDASMARLARLLTQQTKQPYATDYLRQIIHRARERLASFVVERVRNACRCATAEELREELHSLQLWESCKDFVDLDEI
ncbi:MAG: hypothetical protein AB7K24_26050 [Gemmataceae bacterium]